MKNTFKKTEKVVRNTDYTPELGDKVTVTGTKEEFKVIAINKIEVTLERKDGKRIYSPLSKVFNSSIYFIWHKSQHLSDNV